MVSLLINHPKFNAINEKNVEVHLTGVKCNLNEKDEDGQPALHLFK